MMARRWCYLATILTIVVCVYSEQVNSRDDEMQNDLGIVRMTRGRRNVGYLEDAGDERSLLREERKRIKAERRRLKEERRQERWARRQQQKYDGQRDDDDDDEIPEYDSEATDGGGDHYYHITRSSSVPGGPSGAGLTQTAPQSAHNQQPFPSNSGSANNVDVDSTPTVVDLNWLRANISSLWSVVRALSRQQQQGRTVSNRGGHRRNHHHSGVPKEPPNPDACPGGEDACRSDGGEICGGHGICSCGTCFCNPGYYGTFCQCNDHSCLVYDGMTCGGPTRGQCRCGGCICRPGYVGTACDCPTDMQTCMSPDSDGICSGKGTCQCGRCQCSDGHKGMYCQDNVYAAGVCEKLKSCVMCRAWNRDLPSCAQCQITVTTVESLEPSMTTCVMVNSGCLLQFSYIPQTADAYTVLVPRDMVCPA